MDVFDALNCDPHLAAVLRRGARIVRPHRCVPITRQKGVIVNSGCMRVKIRSERMGVEFVSHATDAHGERVFFPDRVEVRDLKKKERKRDVG